MTSIAAGPLRFQGCSRELDLFCLFDFIELGEFLTPPPPGTDPGIGEGPLGGAQYEEYRRWAS